MSKVLFTRDATGELSESYIRLEDDLLELLGQADTLMTTTLWRVCKDFYDDSVLSPAEAQAFAAEVRAVTPMLKQHRTWAAVLEALSREASHENLELVFSAD